MRKSLRIKSVFINALAFALISVFAVSAQELPPSFPEAREADLLELIKLDPTIKLDIRYARSDNFVGRKVYPEARAFLQRPAAEALVRVHRKLKKQGLGLVVYDGYRPWTITKLFWDVTPQDKRIFVANPKTGSRHNRGCAVDLSIFNLKTGRQIPMPSDFDEFSERANPTYEGGTEKQRANRDLLRTLMEAEGFTVNSNEWWHFDFNRWQDYGIYDLAFTEIRDLEAVKTFEIVSVRIEGLKDSDTKQLSAKLPLRPGLKFDPLMIKQSISTINSLKRYLRMSSNNFSWFPDKKNRTVDFIVFVKARTK